MGPVAGTTTTFSLASVVRQVSARIHGQIQQTTTSTTTITHTQIVPACNVFTTRFCVSIILFHSPLLHVKKNNSFSYLICYSHRLHFHNLHLPSLWFQRNFSIDRQSNCNLIRFFENEFFVLCHLLVFQCFYTKVYSIVIGIP